MANNTIKGAGDIYEKDLYGDLAKSAKEVLPLLDKINDALKETTKVNEKLVNTEAKTVEAEDSKFESLSEKPKWTRPGHTIERNELAKQKAKLNG